MFSGVSSGLILCGLLLTMTVVGCMPSENNTFGISVCGGSTLSRSNAIGTVCHQIICQMTLNT